MLYTKYNGSEVFVTLPSHINEEPITGIGPKAFLSQKEIQTLVLPDSIRRIDDWAFSHMHNLTDLTIPNQPIQWGKKVFLGCSNLQHIHVMADTSSNPGLSRFLATTVTVFSQSSLFNPFKAAHAASHQVWMADYDRQLLQYLAEDDLVGFEPIFYGWFNDEDADVSQKPAYLNKQRANKTQLCLLRLKYDLYLSPADRQYLYNYLNDHMPWGNKANTHTAVWDLLPAYCSDDVSTVHILESAGILTADTVPKLIKHLDGAHAEVIAYLLRYQEKCTDFSRFFESFTL
jgi:hypothetical protein